MDRLRPLQPQLMLTTAGLVPHRCMTRDLLKPLTISLLCTAANQSLSRQFFMGARLVRHDKGAQKHSSCEEVRHFVSESP